MCDSFSVFSGARDPGLHRPIGTAEPPSEAHHPHPRGQPELDEPQLRFLDSEQDEGAAHTRAVRFVYANAIAVRPCAAARSNLAVDG